MLTIVGAICTLVALQSYGFLPQYSDVKHYKTRLQEKNGALKKCLTDLGTLNRELRADKQLPLYREQFYAPLVIQNEKILLQNEKSLNYSEDQRKIANNELASCKTKLENKEIVIENLRAENREVKEELLNMKAKLTALVAKSEAEGSCGWFCSGVKVLYNVVQDATGSKEEKKD